VITQDPAYLNLNNLLGRTPIYRATFTKGPATINPGGQPYHWSLNEVSGARVSAAQYVPTISMTSNGGVGSTTGKVGLAADFNGTTQYLSFAGSLLPAGDISFGGRCFFKLTDIAAGRTLASQWGAAGHKNWRVYFDNALDRMVFQITDAADTSRAVVADVPILVNTIYELRWKRLANPSGMIYLQLNTEYFVGGIYQADVNSFGAFTPNPDFSEDIRIGADSNPAANFWKGWIDELTLTRGVLTAEEEAVLYNSGVGNSIPAPASVYTVYKFDTTHNVNAQDEFGAATTAVSALLPVSFERKIEMEYSRFPLNTLTTRIKNQTGTTALFLAASTGATCRFDGAFWDLPGIYIPWFYGQVTDVVVDEGDYVITSRGHIELALQGLLFNGGRSRLSNDVNAFLTDWPIESEFGFSNVDTNEISYAVCENEIVIYHGTRPGLLLSLIRSSVPFAVPPLLADSEAVAHSKGAEVRELVHLGRLHNSNHSVGGFNDLHPVDLLTAALTAGSSAFNTYSAKAQLSRNLGLSFEGNSIITSRAAIGPDAQMLFMDDESSTAKDFIEKEILLPWGLYASENANGQIVILPYPRESDFSPVGGVNSGYDQIDDNHTLSVPAYDKAAETRINQVHYYGDYNPVTREYGKLWKFIDDNLLREHGKSLPLEIYSKGIRSYFDEASLGLGGSRVWFWDTERALLAAAGRHLSRFGSRGSVLRVETILRDHIYECGDDVTGIFANVPDEVNLTVAAFSRPTRVVGITTDFEKNTVTMQLMEHTSFTSSVRKVLT
jgi:hypothetical protein